MKRSKKIRYILNARMPTEKAHGYQSMKTAAAFAENGFDVEVWVPNRKNNNDLINVDIVDYYQLSSSVPIEIIGGYDFIHLLGKVFKKPFNVIELFCARLNTLIFYFMVALRLLRISEEFVIYTRDHNLPLFLNLVLPWKSFDIFVEVHTLSSTSERKKRQAEILSRCSGVVTVTNAMKSRLIDLGVNEQKVLVEPDSVDIEQFAIDISAEAARRRLGLPLDIKIAAFVGKFHTKGNEKGVPESILAIGQLLDRYPNLYGYFVGGPAEKICDYQELMAVNNIPIDRFVFLDKQPVSEVPLWLKSSDVLLMPHPNTEFYAYYVSPLKMFEYMASGRPIVGSNLPSISEVLSDGESALLGNPGDVNGIANNVSRILESPKLANSLSMQALKRVGSFTWINRAKRISDFFSLMLISNAKS